MNKNQPLVFELPQDDDLENGHGIGLDPVTVTPLPKPIKGPFSIKGKDINVYETPGGNDYVDISDSGQFLVRIY